MLSLERVEQKSLFQMNIGIKNVTERLKIFFGEAFTMTIDSKPNEYTKVYLRIPIKRQQDLQ